MGRTTAVSCTGAFGACREQALVCAVCVRRSMSAASGGGEEFDGEAEGLCFCR
jgi:hypothetical protein